MENTKMSSLGQASLNLVRVYRDQQSALSVSKTLVKWAWSRWSMFFYIYYTYTHTHIIYKENKRDYGQTLTRSGGTK